MYLYPNLVPHVGSPLGRSTLPSPGVSTTGLGRERKLMDIANHSIGYYDASWLTYILYKTLSFGYQGTEDQTPHCIYSTVYGHLLHEPAGHGIHARMRQLMSQLTMTTISNGQDTRPDIAKLRVVSQQGGFGSPCRIVSSVLPSCTLSL